MAAEVYTHAKFLLAKDQLRWTVGAEAFRVLLVGASYAYNNAHRFVSDVIAHEVSGGTYARVDVTGRVAVVDYLGDRALLDANNPVFPALSGVTPSGAIVYRRVGPNDATPGDDLLVCYLGFGGPVTTTGQPFMIEFHADGVVGISTC